MDRDHQVLLDIATKLESELSGQQDRERISKLMTELDAYYDAHFENEEELMKKSKYPAIKEHKEEHARMWARTRQLSAAIRTGDVDAAKQTLSALETWLQEHVNGTDRPLAEHLIRRGMADGKR